MTTENLLSLKDDMVAFIEGHGLQRLPGYVNEDIPSIVWEGQDNPDSWKDFVEMAKHVGAPFVTFSEMSLEREELDALIGDEAAVAACWAWEQEYLGMEISGTIHNQVRLTGPLDPPAASGIAGAATGASNRVRQSEPSGGGRAIPQHRRLLARTSRSGEPGHVEQSTAGLVRRTRIRRSRAEIGAVGMLIGAEAIQMNSAPAIHPTFAAHCRTCEFTTPCLALVQGADAEPILAANYGRRRTDDQRKPRLGQSTWGFGRGAAPPQW